MAVSIVYITFKNEKEADKIVSALVKDKLIACANFIPVKNMYVWKKKLVKGKEIVAVCKTKPALINGIHAKVKEMHSYEVPCILSWTVDANSSFEKWVLDSTTTFY